jgi:tetratricopeptide (TPR) repeat protein
LLLAGCLTSLGGLQPAQTFAGAPQTTLPSSVQPSPEAAALVNKGFDLLSGKDAAGAEEAFRKAIDLQPELEMAHRGLGMALRARGQDEAALRELETATRLDPTNADTHYELGMTAWGLSNRVSTPKQAGRSPAQDYRALAANEFRKLAALRPKEASVRQILVEIDLEEGRKDAAFADGQEAIRLAPEKSDAHMVLGRAYFAGGEEEKAVAEYEKALALNPKIGDAYLALGQIRFFQQRYPQAEEYFQQAIRLSPNLAPAYTGLAQIFTQHHRLAEARNMLEKAVALDPQDWQSQYLLAAALNETGETGRATSLLEKITELHPDFLPAREQLVMGLIRRGELKQANAKVDALIAEEPQAAEGHRPRALILWKQHNFEGALAECAMALDTDPDSASMLALQAICLWQFARKRDSQAAYRQAVKIEPRIGTAEVFCRLLLCDAGDIGIVEDFLRRNRWVIAPPPPAP